MVPPLLESPVALVCPFSSVYVLIYLSQIEKFTQSAWYFDIVGKDFVILKSQICLCNRESQVLLALRVSLDFLVDMRPLWRRTGPSSVC